MPQKTQLESIKNFTEFQEEDAAKAFAEVLEKKQLAEKQLTELVSYHKEYEKKLKNINEADSVTLIQQNRQFIQQLGQAIEQQKSIVNKIENELALCLEAWRDTHLNNKGVEHLLEIQEVEDNEHQEQLIQADCDDVVSNKYSRNRLF